ncbi:MULTISPECIES: hypothetical protein [unclassified Phyllobacterium]|uniref:hypothetical protein n=1 Tax=unclassified Phyllobacterium TaxID=2638441 RepID=UPI0030131D3F
MSEHDRDSVTSDEILVAFLDRQLAPEQQRVVAELLEKDEVLVQRLTFLAACHSPVRDAFDALLDEAPTHRMAENFWRAAVRNDYAHTFSRRHMIAAAVSLVALGIGGGIGIDKLLGNRQSGDEDGWRIAVAHYMSLYSTLTLANLLIEPAMLDAQIASVSQALGMPVERKDVTLPGLEFKRVQLLQFKSKPLAQFTYLDEQFEPLALCVFANSSGAALPQFEQRHGMNIVFWSTALHSFLVIGHASPEKLGMLAEQLREAVPV